MEKIKVTLLPENQEIWLPKGELLSEALLVAGYALETPCAGRGDCGKCKVQVQIENPLPQNPAPAGANRHLELFAAEWQHLSLEQIQQGYRLACQVVLDQDLQVQISSEFRDVLRKTMDITNIGSPIRFPLNPLVRKTFLQLPKPSSQDRMGDWERMESGLVEKGLLPRPNQVERGLQLDGSVLKKLPAVLRACQYQVTAVLYDGKLIAVEPGNTTHLLYGIALDIGTTTIVAALFDLHTGEQKAVTSRTNPQHTFGADIISRISFGSQGREQLQKLQASLVEAVNQMIAELLALSDVQLEYIYEAVVVGNTVIHHLFLGLDPTYLGQGPYVPVVTRPIRIKARRLGINILESGYLYLLANINGFVGGDAVGVILATGLMQSEKVQLAVDIGTNGEIVLGSAQRLLACSTAAGPAFEGARIKQGMRAVAGAIDQVRLDRDVELSTIGNQAPAGISGSGLIDAVAEMLRLGIIDHTGRILGEGEWLNPDLPVALRKRIRVSKERREFVLAWGEIGANQEPISILQEDIRELQLAKGAIAAGIQVLQRELRVSLEEITQVYLAGVFGSCINADSARRIGLIPNLPLDRVKAVGNAAGAGAKWALLSRSARKQAVGIAREVEYIEISSRADFKEAFLGAMYFPKGNFGSQGDR